MNVMKESYKYCKRYTPAWITVGALGVLGCLAQLLMPQLPQLIIDRVINPALGADPVVSDNNIFTAFLAGFSADDFWGMFTTILLIFCTLALIRYAGHYIRWNISHFYGVKAEKNIRMAVYDKLMRQNSVVLSHYTSGDMMSIMNSDPVIVKDMYSLYISIIIDQFVVIGFSIFFLARISWMLMIIPMLLGVSTAIVTISYTRALRKRYNDIRERSAELNSVVTENINGVRIIRSYASENIEIEKFKPKNNNYRNGFVSQTKTVSKFQVGFMTMGQIVNLGSIIIGMILAVQGKMSLGEFSTFLSYVFLINGPMTAISQFMGHIQNAMICGNRLFTFLLTHNNISDAENAIPVEGKPDISLRNVSIKLDESEQLINASVEIPYGKKLGLMGKTGSGKSVLIKTLPRFFEASAGEVLINGNDVKRLRVESVRRQFSYVMQDVFLFSNTVDANIALYDEKAPHEQVERVAKVAEAHDFILKLTDGYNTVVGERGLGLSGGQKQRISIARALLKDAPIIMLDDCTSALDLETERKILKSLSEHYADRTVIIASHRASSVVGCDEILYMEDGRIVERGSHDELLKLKGKYYEVFTSQEESYKEAIA